MATQETPEAKVFKHDKHETDQPKESIDYVGTDTFKAQVQLVGEDGANNLHSHTYTDGFWMVLAGGARFYTEDDEVVAELEQNEGVLIPRTYKYWFEPVGDETLEILHIASYAEGPDTMERIDHSEQVDWMEDRHLPGEQT